MAKLRNHGGDPLIGIVQWIGRKARHHDPLAEVEGAPVRGAASAKIRVGISKDDPRKVIYTLADGRRYEFRVREMDPDEEVELVPVGL